MTADQRQPHWRPPRWHAALVLLVCLAIYWPRLGATGFSSTEGHRVIPGWEMLERGEWFLPRMFGQVYLRKPPGMPWAVAASAALFGQSEWSARAVSALAATAMALTALAFGARWFGRPYGLAAGLATALTPVFWPGGRSAEIEALNTFATMAAVLFILDLSIPPPDRRRAGTLLATLGAGLAIAAALLAKGPAGLAAISVAAIAGPLAARRLDVAALRPALRRIAAAACIAALVIAPIAAMIARAVHAQDQAPVRQGVSDFLWGSRDLSAADVGRVLAMPLLALLSALPASLALLFPWGPDARREAESDPRPIALARALAVTCLGSLLILLLAGVNNPRYALPSLSFIPVLAAYILRGHAGAFVPLRQRIARSMLLGHPVAWPVLLLIGAAVYITTLEPRQRATSGRDAGIALAAALPDGARVWADHMIEARPEVLLYAQRAAAADGRRVTFLWIPGMSRFQSLPRDGYLLLRTDDQSGEARAYQDAGFLDRLRPVHQGRVHKFDFTLYEKPIAPGP